jgi:putative hydrolase of the HAD superfamily
LTPIRTVVFDLGGVLIQWNPERILAGFYREPELRAAARQAVFDHPDWRALDQGTLDSREALARFAARTGRPQTEMAALMQAMRESLTPIPESWALVRELAAARVPLYALSNIPTESWQHLAANCPGWNLFQGVLISAEVQALKPDPEIFEHLIRRYRLDRAATVFIDDHEPNVAGARRVGLHGFVFRGAADCRAQLRRLLDQAAA